MLGTKRRSFGNIVGHAKGVGDLSSLSAWTAEQFDPSLSWADVEWVKKQWGGKLILKGIMDKEDARLAVNSGADALIVSNHGGRQLDGAPSSISVLPEIASTVGARIEVMMDGGIRSGQDVLKAVALGAQGTLIGRSFLYGLGALGEAGVTQCLEIIRKELDTSMLSLNRQRDRKSGSAGMPRPISYAVIHHEHVHLQSESLNKMNEWIEGGLQDWDISCGNRKNSQNLCHRS